MGGFDKKTRPTSANTQKLRSQQLCKAAHTWNPGTWEAEAAE